jgi:hypothetical protein
MTLKTTTNLGWRARIGGLAAVCAAVAASAAMTGCGGSRASGQSENVATPQAFVANVEQQCGVIYTRPTVKGKGLGYACGHTSTGRHFAATFTERPLCEVFATLVVEQGADRVQGCISSALTHPRGTITCESGNVLSVAARTQPAAQFATVLLSTHKEVTSGVISLNNSQREKSGGVYFNLLSAKTPLTATLIERDHAGRPLRRTPLTAVGRCLRSK